MPAKWKPRMWTSKRPLVVLSGRVLDDVEVSVVDIEVAAVEVEHRSAVHHLTPLEGSVDPARPDEVFEVSDVDGSPVVDREVPVAVARWSPGRGASQGDRDRVRDAAGMPMTVATNSSSVIVRSCRFGSGPAELGSIEALGRGERGSPRPVARAGQRKHEDLPRKTGALLASAGPVHRAPRRRQEGPPARVALAL